MKVFKQWRLRFANQAKHIDAIVEITEAEGMSLMSIENIMVYTPSEWLSKRSQVIIKFVDTDSEQWRR